MPEEKYYLIRSWMQDLGLRPSELRIYAFIYNFTVQRGSYRGSLCHLRVSLAISRTATYTALKRLEELGLIIREPLVGVDSFGTIRRISCFKAVRPEPKQCSESEHAMFKKRTSDVQNPNTYNNKDKNIEKSKAINKRSTGLTACLDEEFEKLWEKYPRKQGKHEARRAYLSARRSGVTRETISAGLERYLAAIGRDGVAAQFVKRGGSWFRDRLWEDADIGPVKRGFPPSAETRAAQNYMQHSYTAADLLAMGIDTGEDVYEDS